LKEKSEERPWGLFRGCADENFLESFAASAAAAAAAFFFLNQSLEDKIQEIEPSNDTVF